MASHINNEIYENRSTTNANGQTVCQYEIWASTQICSGICIEMVLAIKTA